MAHKEFRELQLKEILKMFSGIDRKKHVLIDVKGIYGIDELHNSGIIWWRL